MGKVRRTARWAVVALVLVASIWGLYLLLQRSVLAGSDIAANRLLLVLLTAGITVLALGLAGVLVRNLVRLIVERKRGILGAKLRTKLVFFFLAFVLLPAFLLSYGAGAIIKQTVEAMLRSPVDEVSQAAREIADEYDRLVEASCLAAAERVAADLGPAARGPSLEARLRTEIERGGLDLVLVTRGAAQDALASRPGAAERAVEAALRAARPVLEGGGAEARVEDVEGGMLVAGVAPLPADPATGHPTGVVVAGRIVGPGVLQRVDRLDRGMAHFREFKSYRRETLRVYQSLIAMIGLATVFVATWIGFYLSRRITGPIQELARATREISAGNLGVRVRADAGDEVGMLVEAFNEMAAQLQESREVITRSAAELRRSYEELDERRRYIETLVANLSTAVLSLDRRGRVTTANPVTERILGLRVEPGEELERALAEAGLEPLREFLREAQARPGLALRRDLVLSRGGGEIAVSAQVTPLRGGREGDLGILLMVEDLTDLLRAQRASAWREVARRIAHEIKNPLTPIQLAAQRLRKKFAEAAPDLPEVMSEATASIEREVGALQRLVDEFSRFARMPEVTPELVEFQHVVDSVLALYQGHPGVRWEVQTDPRLGVVRVDPEQMRRALINLIENALAAIEGAGTVRIATSAPAGPGSLRIEVSDSGPGIPVGDRDKLFLPYFSTKRKGTGLGLAIVHRVVTDHRGTIRVEDNPPRGARFVIEIPA